MEGSELRRSHDCLQPRDDACVSCAAPEPAALWQLHACHAPHFTSLASVAATMGTAVHSITPLAFARLQTESGCAEVADAAWRAGACAVLLVKISYAQRNFQTALSVKDRDGFHAALWQFVAIIVAATPSFALADWLEVRGAPPPPGRRRATTCSGPAPPPQRTAAGVPPAPAAGSGASRDGTCHRCLRRATKLLLREGFATCHCL